jgi:hypothetical protein
MLGETMYGDMLSLSIRIEILMSAILAKPA